ncbi:MAG: SH3 domain-containing protein, partial [Oscillospiraceae bacterium]|nr:SH3 domain-containing protein [Oscillospiraceae bacterium]
MLLIKSRRCIRSWLTIFLIICLTLSFTVISNAEEITKVGVVVGIDTSLNVRSGPGTSHTAIGKLSNGNQVLIYSQPSSGWYKISYNNSYGYVSSAYISVTGDYVPPADYNTYLANQGFPESYWPALQQLHTQYPAWAFTAKQTGLDWSTVISNESVVKRNTIPNSYSDSWKSYEKGAYDWSSNSSVIVDTGGWVTASSDLISYYMDPRNMLGSTNVFQFKSFGFSDSETVDGVKNILNGLFMYPYAGAIVSAAKEANVSAYMLASRVAQEQGETGNSIGTGTTPGYEGYYNFFNIKAAAGGGNDACTNGAIYAKAQGWDTAYEAILGGAVFLGENYIYKEQNTLYFQKFNVVNTVSGLYYHQYMTNVMAPCSEGAKLKSAYTAEQLKSEAISFSIPVYNNMPSSAVSKPTASGNNNNLLSSLSVSGAVLSQSFDRYNYSYNAIVSSDVSNVTVNAVASDSGAAVSGAGNIGLSYGDNNINISVTATNGSTRIYTISVNCQSPISKIVSVSYKSHLQDYGWQTVVSDGALSGTTGELKRLEGIKITVQNNSNLGIKYSTHLQDIGWQGYVSDGAMSGTEGLSKRLEAIKIELTGTEAELYDVYYRVHAQDYGWLSWAKNGRAAGTEGLSKRLEAIEIAVVKKNSVSYDTSNSFVSAYGNSLITYRTHVQDIGWQGFSGDGKLSGTTGKSLRLEGINIKLSTQLPSGSVSYSTHVQDIGWMNSVSDGALSGTTGKAKRLEGIVISLSGEVSKQYDIYYRVHVQDYGWMGWAKNGEIAGSAGFSYRLECIQIVLVLKGGAAPG